MNLAFTFAGTPDSLNFVFYIVNSGKLFVMESDAVTTATPLLNVSRGAAANSRGGSHQCFADRQHGDLPSPDAPCAVVERAVCPKLARVYSLPTATVPFL